MRVVRCWNCKRDFNFLTKSSQYDAVSGLCVDCFALRDELQQVNAIQRIRSGKLDTVRPSVVLPPAELCFWSAPATYYKVLSSSTKTLHGNLVVTDHKVRFISPTGGFEFPISKVASVNLREPSGVVLQLTRSQGSGYYALPGAVFLYEKMQIILNVHHRKVLYGQSASRSIPQAVKSAVYQRDGGRCIECGDDQYLEFDHVIPLSRGGASSENNLQLLCRRCNMSKADKI